MAQVDNLTISCIDFRFRAGIAQWIKHQFNDQSDLVVLAGASKATLDEDTQPAIMKQIDLASQLHSIKTVHIVDHVDCGAYGGSAKFNGNKEAEVSMHNEELEKAKQAILSKFPSLSVETHIIDFDGML